MPKKSSGFTLIELLVAISIIAILSVVGFVSYQNVSSKAKDAKMKADIDAIKKAYETNYDPSANSGQGGYKSLSAGNFANGKIPTPDGTSATSYLASGPDVTGVGNSTTGFAACATINGSNYCATSTQGSSSQPLITGTQAIPGTSCQDILTKSSGVADGVYWIKPDSNLAFQVYCGMTSDGGGWTLALKSLNDNTDFNYTSSYWTTSNTLAPTDFEINNTTNSKYDSFNTLKFKELLITDGNQTTKRMFTLASSLQDKYTLLDLTSTSRDTNTDETTESNYVGTDYNTSYLFDEITLNGHEHYICHKLAFNGDHYNTSIDDHAVFRIGYNLSQEYSCGHPGTAEGFGLRQVAGGTHNKNSGRVQWGEEPDYFSKGLVYIR